VRLFIASECACEYRSGTSRQLELSISTVKRIVPELIRWADG
jgi:hypothetical protein